MSQEPLAATTRAVPLMKGLRNLEKGYNRKFALSYCADDVWRALEALEEIANHDLQVDYADCELRMIARRALR